MGLRKLWALVGIGTVEEGSRPRTLPRASTASRSSRRRSPAIDPGSPGGGDARPAGSTATSS